MPKIEERPKFRFRSREGFCCASLKKSLGPADSHGMSFTNESLSLFYLSNVLLVLVVAGFAGWIGPRVALSRWRSNRGAGRKTPPADGLEPPTASLNYEDAIVASQMSDAPPATIPLPEGSDAFTLKTEPEEERVEIRRAYLKLLQCYNQPPLKPKVKSNEDEGGSDVNSFKSDRETHSK